MRVLKKSFALWAVLAPLLLVACGDDGSTEAKCLDCEENGRVLEAASLDELPECAVDNGGSLAIVDGMYYACVLQDWEKVVEVARGVCNVRPCDKTLDGQWVYVYSEGKPYQCKSGLWKDAKGNLFDELEFVDCFMNALVQDTVGSEEDLKACTENKEGDIFVAGKNMVACLARKWVEIPGGVVSESDLPDCSGNGYIYVMGKMAVYQCKDGVWYGNGKAVTKSSVDQPKSSSSQAEKMESSPSGSGKTSSSSKEVVDDGTKVRGVCAVSEKKVDKNVEVTYSFSNMGGTVITYSWEFEENASVSTSTKPSPKISYKKGGNYRAKLILNKGLKSESEEIECPSLKVDGTPVTGCECTTDATGLIVGDISASSATWTVSGCIGASPFTYEWGGGASGTGTSAVGAPSVIGNYAPTLTVTNSDGGEMQPECKAIPATKLSINCSISAKAVSIYPPFNGVSDQTPSLDFELVTAGGGASQKLTVDAQYYDYDGTYRWDWTSVSFPISAVSSYAKYLLKFAGKTVCSASLGFCNPSKSSIYNGESVSWYLKSGTSVVSAKSYQWKFTDDDGNILMESEEASPAVTATALGYIRASLTVDKGLASENTLSCGTAVVSRPITGCTCGEPELVSESNDLADESPVSYRWTVEGCKSTGAEPLSYTWDESYTQDAESPNVAEGDFSTMGYYSPTVVVENKDGTSVNVSCKRAVVKKNGNYGYLEVDYLSDILEKNVLGSGSYIIKGCASGQSGDTWQVSSSTAEFMDYVESSNVEIMSDWGTGGEFRVTYPVYMRIPDGKSVTIRCW